MAEPVGPHHRPSGGRPQWAVEVVEYSAEWPEMFRREAALLKELLRDELIAVFHIGSTSVPGLPAKPIIDLLPVVADIDRLDGYAEGFVKLGYEVWGEYGIPGRRYYSKGGAKRTHHIHAFQYDSLLDIGRHLAFRDFLRTHESTRAEYARLKIELARQYPKDIDNYCQGKDDFVKRLEREALKWHWAARQSNFI